ncbi:MAG TPA: hypothetical protein VNA25_28090 [Phycisphaerae bacterium]|nr:hypothetical protein [Phycisphaerae bacterium]
MTEKLDYYDILGSLVPGVLLVCWVPVCFPTVTEAFPGTSLPEAFSVIAFVALAIFAGQVVQSIGSLIEKPLFWTWGGQPSDRAMREGLGRRYLPEDAASRIRARLASVVGPNASDRSLFLYAMQCTDSTGIGRSPRFNSLYAYHRALLVLVIAALLLLLASAEWGAAKDWPVLKLRLVEAGMLLLIILVWHRAKQRAFYYVREVLLSAEKVLSERMGEKPHS